MKLNQIKNALKQIYYCYFFVFLFLFCFVLFCFVLFCFVLFCLFLIEQQLFPAHFKPSQITPKQFTSTRFFFPQLGSLSPWTSSGCVRINFFWGGTKIFRGAKMYKMHTKHTRICHFYAESVKFVLILTHLKLFWGENWGERKYFRANSPMSPMACHCETENQC